MRSQIRARERVVMARNCEPEMREHLAMRMKRRGEIMKREAKAAGRSLHVARASPHYTTIQNVCLPLFERFIHVTYLFIDDLLNRPRSH